MEGKIKRQKMAAFSKGFRKVRAKLPRGTAMPSWENYTCNSDHLITLAIYVACALASS